MPIREAAVELLAILDRFLDNTGDKSDQAALLRLLESLRSLLESSGQTVFNIDIKQLTGGNNQFGDIYNQIYNQTYNQTD